MNDMIMTVAYMQAFIRAVCLPTYIHTYSLKSGKHVCLVRRREQVPNQKRQTSFLT